MELPLFSAYYHLCLRYYNSSLLKNAKDFLCTSLQLSYATLSSLSTLSSFIYFSIYFSFLFFLVNLSLISFDSCVFSSLLITFYLSDSMQQQLETIHFILTPLMLKWNMLWFICLKIHEIKILPSQTHLNKCLIQ